MLLSILPFTYNSDRLAMFFPTSASQCCNPSLRRNPKQENPMAVQRKVFMGSHDIAFIAGQCKFKLVLATIW